MEFVAAHTYVRLPGEWLRVELLMIDKERERERKRKGWRKRKEFAERRSALIFRNSVIKRNNINNERCKRSTRENFSRNVSSHHAIEFNYR